MYNIPKRPQHNNPQLKPIYNPRTKHLKSSIFYKISKVYANLLDTLKSLPTMKFKKQIKAHIQSNFNPYEFLQTKSDSESDTESDTD